MDKRAVVCGLALVVASAGAAWAGDKTKPTAEDKKANKTELGLKGKTVAKADIAAKSGSKVGGSATFTDDGKGLLLLRIGVKDAHPGVHALHIHVKDDC